MRDWWQDISSEQEAWEKIVGVPEVDPEDTKRNVEFILNGCTSGVSLNALDIGAGMGRLVKEMGKKFRSVTGVDISEPMVEYAKKYLGESMFLRVLKGDGSHLPVESGSFHFAYSYISFQHMHTLEVVRTNIEEIYRVLKPNGMCRIQTVKGKSYRSEKDNNHAYLFEDENDFLQLFLDAGFDAKVMVGGTHFQHIWVTGVKPCATS